MLVCELFPCTIITCISRAASGVPHLFGLARIQKSSLVTGPRNTSIMKSSNCVQQYVLLTGPAALTKKDAER